MICWAHVGLMTLMWTVHVHYVCPTLAIQGGPTQVCLWDQTRINMRAQSWANVWSKVGSTLYLRLQNIFIWFYLAFFFYKFMLTINKTCWGHRSKRWPVCWWPNFLWLSLGRNQYRREGLWFVCLLYDGSTRRLTESGFMWFYGFMEKPGIEPATPGLQGIALIHYTTGAGGQTEGANQVWLLWCNYVKQLFKEIIISRRC